MMYNTNNPLEVQNLRLKIEKLIENQSNFNSIKVRLKPDSN